MQSVFFYGLFMDKDYLIEKGLSPQNVRKAHLKDFRLRIGERATLEQSQGGCVYGTVMQLEDAELQCLYGDDSVADYLLQKVKLNDEAGGIVEAVTYILPMGKVSGSNAQYAIELSRVAEKLKMPKTYIQEIESWI